MHVFYKLIIHSLIVSKPRQAVISLHLTPCIFDELHIVVCLNTCFKCTNLTMMKYNNTSFRKVPMIFEEFLVMSDLKRWTLSLCDRHICIMSRHCALTSCLNVFSTNPNTIVQKMNYFQLELTSLERKNLKGFN